MKVFVATITVNYADENAEILTYEITRVFDAEEKATTFVFFGMNEKEIETLWEEEVRSSYCLFDTDKLEEVIAYGIIEREVL